MTATRLTWSKEVAGWYEARVGEGWLDRYEIRRVKPIEDEGYGLAATWNLTYPGERCPGDVYATLREAKAGAQCYAEE